VEETRRSWDHSSVRDVMSLLLCFQQSLTLSVLLGATEVEKMLQEETNARSNARPLVRCLSDRTAGALGVRCAHI
jgi:hypothetical protein